MKSPAGRRSSGGASSLLIIVLESSQTPDSAGVPLTVT